MDNSPRTASLETIGLIKKELENAQIAILNKHMEDLFTFLDDPAVNDPLVADPRIDSARDEAVFVYTELGRIRERILA